MVNSVAREPTFMCDCCGFVSYEAEGEPCDCRVVDRRCQQGFLAPWCDTHNCYIPEGL